jgi:SAM-dependent methyltransferase
MQLNWLMRYQPVVRLLDGMPAGTVLDVGSGWHGLSSYRTGRTVQTDLAFLGSPPERDRPGTALFLAATAEKLPFADRSFDYAVSLDMFEHLPAGIREESVRELCRVARRAVLVGFPAGRPAKAVDETLYRLIRLRRGSVPDWLVEHREQERYPDYAMLADALPHGWVIAREVKSGNVASQTALVFAEQVPGVRRITQRLERHWRVRGVPPILDRGVSYRTIFVVQPEPSI